MDRPRASHREERFRKSRLEECMQMPEEPELPDVPDDDKPIIRNIIYTAWAMQEGGCRGGSYGWQVQPKRDGYLVLVSLPSTFSVSLQDLQLIADVNPLRIDSIMVRNPENRNQYSAVVAEGEEAGSVDEGDADAKVEAEAGGAGAGEDRFGTGGSRKRKSGSEEAPADLSKGKKPKSGGPGSAGEPLCSQIRHRAIGGSKGWNLGAVIAVKVLDQSQPVRITEAEVVRVKKRHRGFFQRMLMGD